MTAPTRLIGRATQYDHGYDTVLDELTVDLPADLIWPLSVPLYASMSREAHLGSLLAAYELQLRRGQWQLDGRGCRPEVVRFVADDMGLLIAGDEEPGPARTRGVSWNEHLRSALLSLRFGHSAHELLAEVRDGRAHLAALAERMPWTINKIHVNARTGGFEGISQDQVRLATDSSPQIKAERLAFYVNERIGPNWAGTSLLRNCYAPWLIKKELMRVHAIANRRWSAGVPVMEALPGTNPTQAQMQEAQALASAARAGDQAGAATPPGFALKILGLSGAVPDTLAFMEYLDRAMAKAALMGHIELGMGDNSGSRALGTAMIESWTLALESLAEGIADTATRQVAARIVEWNWGPDEAVPRVVVSGIGSRREVTAESLKLLLDSKALSADTGLEEWIRREWRLPEREGGAPTVAPSTERVAAAAGRPKGRSRRREAAGQLTLPVLAAAPAREPSELEQQAGVDFAAIQAEYEQALADLQEQWPDLSEAVIAGLVAAVVAAVAAGAVAELGQLAVSAAATSALATAVAAGMVALAASAAAGAAAELRSQGVPVDAGQPDEVRLREVAEATAGVIAGGYATGAARTALQHAGPGADPDSVGRAVREHLTELSDAAGQGWVSTNLAGALSAAQNAGRAATFDRAPEGTRFASSEVLDRSTCANCQAEDGTVYDTLAEAVARYANGGLVTCLGGLRCRGILVAVAS